MKSPFHIIPNRIIPILILFLFQFPVELTAGNSGKKTFYIDENSSFFVESDTWVEKPGGGDTIFISARRKKALKFRNLEGTADKPLVVINTGGQVQIDDSNAWGAITFENCRYIKITGTGQPEYRYGFSLSASSCGLAFSELSSDCEAEFVKIDHNGFYGIFSKKNYNGNPPSPVPVFYNLIIHDCFIKNVTEGMYLGETVSPGMEFKHVRIYNNIVVNTGREAIQIANMTGDVKIHHNTLLNAGRNNEPFQNNILQIGDNTEADIYYNIFSGAPGYGIISFGKGNNNFQNNYIADCNGIFIDDRVFCDSELMIIVSDNYFVNIGGKQIIKNMNDINSLLITGNSYNTVVSFFDNASHNQKNYTLSENLIKPLKKIEFTDEEKNDYSLAPTSEFYKGIGAPGGPEYFETPKVSSQIVLDTSMITDQVEGGSYISANYLVDEQWFSPENKEHPVSESWKPYWNMDLAPYWIIIDLQKEYCITTIALHDMYYNGAFEIAAGEPDNWNILFTDDCINFNTWNIHDTHVKTRYLRLSMNESVFAAVNEIVIYGYVDLAEENTLNPEENEPPVVSEDDSTDDDIFIVQNPVQDILKFSVPKKTEQNFTIELFDIKGIKVFSKNYSGKSYSQQREINLSSIYIKNGLYFARFTNESGRLKTIKFIKQSY